MLVCLMLAGCLPKMHRCLLTSITPEPLPSGGCKSGHLPLFPPQHQNNALRQRRRGRALANRPLQEQNVGVEQHFPNRKRQSRSASLRSC
ncbi:hypothetical protein AVEN_211736-1 [Araneus ventricosus]|uniref:Uncharacterized protein n=1 Tax=Araneus ventricosus TaxID=182803 RepID=A0A4Y2TG75_ARAVE|nr:hypothetical protein AVEN_97772-1 [Araneus ventricosus]GBN99634.1 hypothetical protein AVEN_211736-1 [Araneus ventricosus]